MNCPCENCLVLAKCRNKYEFKPYNFKLIVDECPNLRAFLGLEKPPKLGTIGFVYVTTLPRFTFTERLKIVSRLIPYNHITVRSKWMCE